MAQCVAVVGGSVVEAAEPCTGFLLLSPAEYAQVVASPFNLTAEDGLTLSVAILGVWAVAWSIRALVRALDTDGEVRE